MFSAIKRFYSTRFKATHLPLLLGAALLLGASGCSSDQASGCVVDDECKLDRICSEQGRCVYSDRGDTGGQDPEDAGSADTSADDSSGFDSGPVDAGSTDGGNDVAEDAPTTDADDGGSSDAEATQDADPVDGGDTGQPASECGAYPNIKICIEVEWEQSSAQLENGRDIDLHYLHPLGRWNTKPFDIFWDNQTSDWNEDGLPDGDPTLVTDANAGPGPEVITHDNPDDTMDDTIYTVGLYYYNDVGLGSTPVTVRVFIDGQQRYETASPLTLSVLDFAEVVTISWPSRQITVIERVHDGFPG